MGMQCFQRGTSVPANLSLVAILDDAEKYGFSVRHRTIVESVVIGLTKRTGFDWRELDMLEETDVIIENIRNAICTVTGYIPPRRPYPEDEMDPVQ
jgi:hypothetical protein